MRRPRITLKHFMGLIFVLAVVLYVVFLPEPKDILRSLMLGHDTVYAPGFSERNFRRIQIGMTPEEVEATMGWPPLGVHKYPDNYQIWNYTQSPGDTHHFKRNVAFEHGRVVGIASLYYVD